MKNEKRLIDANALVEGLKLHGSVIIGARQDEVRVTIQRIKESPTVDAISVTEIKAYLQARLDDWNALGDRKFEPANMWGYNFIMACFDDLEKRCTDGKAY